MVLFLWPEPIKNRSNFRKIKFLELQQNMRQKGDLIFVEMLGRIRLGSPTVSDIELLKERVVKNPLALDTGKDAEGKKNHCEHLTEVSVHKKNILYLAGPKQKMNAMLDSSNLPNGQQQSLQLNSEDGSITVASQESALLYPEVPMQQGNTVSNIQQQSLISSEFSSAVVVEQGTVVTEQKALFSMPTKSGVVQQQDHDEHGIFTSKVNSSDLLRATKLFSYLLKKDPRAVCLLPKNNMVDLFNEAMIKEAKLETVTISAVDYDSGQNTKTKKKPRSSKRKGAAKGLKSSDTAGLQEQLVLGVGARVMLRRNISLENGLVNGAIGYVTSITKPLKTPPSIYVQFEDHSTPTEITPVCADYEVSKGIIVSRRQFPLCLGYALTIHKSQGLTLRSILVDLGPDIFESGMAYVALSRVKSLDGIYLLDLHPAVLYCDDLAAKQYGKWRSESGIVEELGPVNHRPLPYQSKPFQLKKQSKPKCASKHTAAKALALRCSTEEESLTKLKCSKPSKASSNVCMSQKGQKCVWVPLDNPAIPNKTLCYSNVIIQSLRQMPLFIQSVSKWISTAAPSDQLNTAKELLHLCTVSDCLIQTTKKLRELLAISSGHAAYADFSQEEDAHWLFDSLVQNFSFGSMIPDLFTFFCNKQLICTACPQPVIGPVDSQPWTSIHLACEQSQSFSGLMDKYCSPGEVVKKCEQCGVQRVHTERVSYNCGPHQKYLIILLSQFITDSEGSSHFIRERKIRNFVAGNLYIKQFCRFFQTVAAVNRLGDSATVGGHFTCWVHDGKQWLLIDDSKLHKSQARFVNGLRDVYMLCLKLL